MPTLEITPTRMVIADKFDSENDHLRLAAGEDRVPVSEGPTSGRGSNGTSQIFLWHLDGVTAVWDIQFTNTSISHDLDASTYEVGI